jgi:Rod binding domain-containing protein
MDAVNPPSTNSYLDFDGLGQLKGQARKDAKGAMRETAQQFEALFLQMMMKSMRESIVKSEMSESNTMETFEGMFDKNLEQQQANIATTADILKQRQDPAALNATKPFPLNPQAVGMSLDKVLNPKQNGFALPKAASGYMLNANPKFLLGGDK